MNALEFGHCLQAWCNVFPNKPPLLLSERNGFPILLPLYGQAQEGGMVGKGRN